MICREEGRGELRDGVCSRISSSERAAKPIARHREENSLTNGIDELNIQRKMLMISATWTISSLMVPQECRNGFLDARHVGASDVVVVEVKLTTQKHCELLLGGDRSH